MANIERLFSYLRCSILHSPRNIRISESLIRSCSNFSNLPKKPDKSQMEKKDEEGKFLIFKDPNAQKMITKYWNEPKAIKQLRRKNSYPRNVDNMTDLWNGLVVMRKTFPGTLKGLIYWMEKRLERRELIEQKFLPERHKILRPDLAAAHFLVRRGGCIKFLGQPHWVGIKEKNVALPNTYIPGLYLEAINLEGTRLHYEGLLNICDLDHLKSLSLKNLENVNDWWLDRISINHCSNLEHLDLTGCKNVTYKGFSCFYRFERLKTLNVEGVPSSPEFKLACIMLQDIMPELDILGIDLSLPEEIKALGVQQNKTFQDVNECDQINN